MGNSMTGPACSALVDKQGFPLVDIHFVYWETRTARWVCDACEIVKFYRQIVWRNRGVVS